ncbi:hypothetical protein ACJJTC_007080 [Scirpophaga incertulas]
MEGVSLIASGNKFQSLTAITANDFLYAVELYVGTMRSKTLRGRSRASGIVRYWKQSRSHSRPISSSPMAAVLIVFNNFPTSPAVTSPNSNGFEAMSGMILIQSLWDICRFTGEALKC